MKTETSPWWLVQGMQRGIEQCRMQSEALGVEVIWEHGFGEHLLAQPPSSAQPLEAGAIGKPRHSQPFIQAIERQRFGAGRRPLVQVKGVSLAAGGEGAAGMAGPWRILGAFGPRMDRQSSAAAAIGSGLWGVENKIEPTDAVEGNAYDKKAPARLQLPRTLDEAAERLYQSKAARSLFGDEFVTHFVASRRWEWKQFSKAVTSWELARYFEVI